MVSGGASPAEIKIGLREICMNIYAKENDKVVFLGSDEEVNKWGNCDNSNDLLVIGEKYTIDHTEVHSWHTKVFLKEVVGGFNSILFDDV